jgi:ABC-type antimicrobial peptide transport system permease subunit
MIKNFFRIAVRNIARHKGFTFINVTGLAVGLAATLLILLWVQDELSFEKYNLNAEKIFRVEEDQFYSGEKYHVTVTPVPAGPVWKEKIPEIKDQVRINLWLPRVLFTYNDKIFFESSIAAVDSNLLKIFTLPLSFGDPESALNAPHSIILTQKLATKYFGNENPVGKILTVENSAQFTVTGVFKEIPDNSMLTFSAVIPYSYMKEIGRADNSWGNNSIFTFIQLEKGANIEAVNKKLTDIVVENAPEITTKYSLFPLLDIHLHGQFGFTETRGPVIVVSIFTLIAIFILLIACINFINLSTAKASGRGKEIGIKKVAGAEQISLIFQFMLESLLLVTIAMILALILVGLSLGLFNNISGKTFILEELFQLRFIINFIVVGLLAGLISGIYPAFYLSSFKPVTVLKGEGVTKGSGKLRRILVVVQFTLSILIAISAIFMYKQLMFLQNKDLGYNKENLICIPMPENMKPRYYSLKRELEKETLIQGVTASMWNPTSMGSNAGGASWDGKDPEKQVLIGTNGIDYDYLKTLNMELKSGRDFSNDFPADMAKDTTGNFLINEEVVKLMGIEDPVGKNFRFMGLNGTITGVLKNFHFKGADQAIEPMAFALAPVSYLRVILIRLTPGNIPESLKAVEKSWKAVVPEYPLDYTFIDQDYDKLFRAQIRLSGLLKYFTILAVIIACLGLYGLSSYSADRRTNEVGIRKVMGAGSFTVMYTLAIEFLLPVLVSIIIAIPLGWIIVSKLLKQFAYRIDLNIIVFAEIAAGAIIIALLTVSFHAYKATGINPAEALKIE